MKTLTIAVLTLVALGYAGAVQAETQCEASVKEVQAKWDKMYPMGMDTNSSYRAIADNFRIAKENCKAGDTAGTETYLNVVRGHLGMEQHEKPHVRQ